MTLLDPPDFSSSHLLFLSTVEFPQVLAQPRRQRLPEGDVLTFRFPNGYGAAVTRLNEAPAESAFEFGVLDCTGEEDSLTSATALGLPIRQGLTYEQTAGLLMEVERLPLHPAVERANAELASEIF